MSTAYSDSALEPRTDSWHERFANLVCQHDDLVHAEFDAIIAAAWPSLHPDSAWLDRQLRTTSPCRGR
jgi:hypothetical protein